MSDPLMLLMWQGQQEHTGSDIFTNSIIKQGFIQMWKIVDGGGSISLLLFILITFSAAETNISDKSI